MQGPARTNSHPPAPSPRLGAGGFFMAVFLARFKAR